MTEPPPIPPPPRPRVWTVLVMTACALLASVGSAVVVLVIALFKLGVFKRGLVALDGSELIARLLEQPWGTTVIVLPGQATMLAVAIAATLLARRPLAARLGYTPSLLPWRALPLLLAGTLFAGGIGGVIAEWLFPEPSPGMKMISDMIRKPSGGTSFASLAIMICILPPLCEETLFRGYLQRRLLQRWHPVAAIGVSSLFFVTAHFDPEHVLAVIPLGVWLGVVAWRSNSLWPSMLCHFAQNSMALVGTRLMDPSNKKLSGGSPAEVAVIAVAGALTVWAVVIMRRHPVPGRIVTESGPAPLSAA